MRRTDLLLVTGSLGAGHVTASRVLRDRMQSMGLRAQIVDYLDLLPSPISAGFRRGYPQLVDATPSLFQWLYDDVERGGRPTACGIQAITSMAASNMQPLLGNTRAVLSMFPLGSRALGELIARGAVDPVTVATYVTDAAPQRFWLHPGITRVLTAHRRSAELLQLLAPDQRNVHAGTLVGESFRAGPDPAARRRWRSRLGIAEETPVGLVTGGSLGMGRILETAHALRAQGIHALVVSGRHRPRVLPDSQDYVTMLGWTDDMSGVMDASDALVDNAGGMTTLEAAAKRLPTVFYNPIPGHGRANAHVMHAAGTATWARDESELAAAVACSRGNRTRATAEPDAAAVIVRELGLSR